MQIRLVVVGKLKEEWLRGAFAEYEKRLSRYCKFSCIELPETRLSDAPSPAEIRQALEKEGKAIMQAAEGTVIAMCIDAKQRTSEEFAAMLDRIAVGGDSTVTFLIGSSFGLADAVIRSADQRLSLSKMTFTHQIARVLLAEQIYRAFQINTGGKYHK